MLDSRMSRFAKLALVIPPASYLPSPEGSVVVLKMIGSPVTVVLAKRPGPPFWRTYMPCGANGSVIAFESANAISASPCRPIRVCRKSPSVRSPH